MNFPLSRSTRRQHILTKDDSNEQFWREGYNGWINDVEILSINKAEPSIPTRSEAFWRTKLKILYFVTFAFAWKLNQYMVWIWRNEFLLRLFGCFSFGHFSMLSCILKENVSYWSDCFCRVLKDKDYVRSHKFFVQSHFKVRLQFRYCLWTIGLLAERNVYDIYKSLIAAH